MLLLLHCIASVVVPSHCWCYLIMLLMLLLLHRIDGVIILSLHCWCYLVTLLLLLLFVILLNY